MQLSASSAELLFSNFASSTLFSGISAVATAITVQAGDGELFPAVSGGQYLLATLEDDTANKEIVKVTARVGDVFTVERAQEGTLARAYNVNSRFELRLTTEFLKEFVDGRAFLEDGVRVRVTRSEDPGDAPVFLAYGELALNITDRILFVGNASNGIVNIPIPNLGYLDWEFPTVDFSAKSGGRYFVSSLTVGIIVLPAIPDIGRSIRLADMESSWDGSTTVNGNGNTIHGLASFILDTPKGSLEFSYDGADWKVAG